MTDKKVLFISGQTGCGKSQNAQRLADFFGCKSIVQEVHAAQVRRVFDQSEGDVLVLGLPEMQSMLSMLPTGTEVHFLDYYDACRAAGFSPFHGPDGQLHKAFRVGLAYGDAARELQEKTFGATERVLAQILKERDHQRAKGYTASIDDRHTENELPQAAVSYVLNAALPAAHVQCLFFWPWDVSTFNPEGRRADLIKAAALLVAEIERMDRAIAAKTSGTIDPVAE